MFTLANSPLLSARISTELPLSDRSTFNLSFANYSRKSGSEELYDVDINEDDLLNMLDVIIMVDILVGDSL